MARTFSLGMAAILATLGSASAQSLVERGDYLVNNLMACGNCHTPRIAGQGATPDLTRRLAGGTQVFNEVFFTVKGANITQDRETGIGSWSNADIKRALVDGVHPNGTPLAMIMPSSFYKALTPTDLDAIVAYLRTVPAVRNEVQSPVYKAAPTTQDWIAEPMAAGDLSDPVKHGFYLGSLAHCMGCHARTSEQTAPDFKTALGRGGRVFKGPFGQSVAANITSHKEKGIGAWSDEEIRNALTLGVSRDGRKLKPPMSDYVAYYRTWKVSEISALIAWLRTLPPLE